MHMLCSDCLFPTCLHSKAEILKGKENVLFLIMVLVLAALHTQEFGVNVLDYIEYVYCSK